jgi:hypothetical protein
MDHFMKIKKMSILILLFVVLTVSACGKPIDSSQSEPIGKESVTEDTENNETPICLSSPVLIKKDRVVEDIYNHSDDYAVVFGVGEKPWILPKERGESFLAYDSESGNELIVYSNKHEIGIGDFIYKTLENEIKIENADRHGYSLSADGTTFTYVKWDSRSFENVLYVVKNYETKELLRDEGFFEVYLPPDGGAIGINVSDRAIDLLRDSKTSCYVIMDDEITSLGYGKHILGISNNAEYLYFLENGTVYMQNGLNADSRKKIYSLPLHQDQLYSYRFNADYSQLYFGIWDGYEHSTYLVINGGEPIKIANLEADYNMYDIDAWGQPIDFTTGLWYGNADGVKYTLYALDGNMKLQEIAPAVTEYTVLPDKKFCYYTKDDALYRLDLSGGEPNPIKIASDVPSFECDGDIVYCINKHESNLGDDNGEEIIFSVDQNGNKLSITEDFDAYSVCGDDLYYLDDLTVYRSNGGLGELVGNIELSFPETNISEINMEATYSGYIIVKFWEKDSDSETYISKNGEEFVNIESLK